MHSPSLVAVFVLVSSLFAQTFVTSPPGFETKLGTARSTVFGSGSYARFMMLDGEFRTKPMTVKSVSYRSRSYYATEERRWSDITLRTAECDFDKVPAKGTVAFTSVPTTTPTTVFQGSMTWPGIARGAPASWVVRVPFKTAWSYTGKQDICLDYRFTAGILKSGTTPWWKGWVIAYYLDGYPLETFLRTWQKDLGRSCQDSYPVRSGILIDAYTYGPRYSDPRLRNHHSFAVRAFTGPSTTGAFALSLSSPTSGVPIPGVTCEKIYLDLTKPAVYRVMQSAPSGWSQPFSAVPPFAKRYVAVPFWAQGVWLDSKTRATLVTNAAQSNLPPLPPDYRRKCVHAKDNPALAGTVEEGQTHNPIARYER